MVPTHLADMTSDGLFVSETEGGVLTLDSVPGFAFEVAPGSVTFPDGSREGTIAVTPVNTAAIPMPPPMGMQPNFIITVQPGGAHFDPPARMTLPTVDGFPPGAQTEMRSGSSVLPCGA